MSRFQVSANLAASPSDVWGALTALDAFPEWNPFIVRASGELRRGEQIAIHLMMGGPFPTRLRPRLTAVEAERELRWLWVVVHPRLFTADRYFLLEPRDEGTRFVQGEAWSGMLAPLLTALGMHRPLHGRIRAMTVALRKRLGS